MSATTATIAVKQPSYNSQIVKSQTNKSKEQQHKRQTANWCQIVKRLKSVKIENTTR
jgi:hypothetical protein